MTSLRRIAAPFALSAVLVAGLAACSDSGEEQVRTDSTEVEPSSTTTSAPATTTTAPSPSTSTGSPSTLPPDDPGTGPVEAACAALAEALPVADLLPRDGLSWPDERQRALTDAQLSAALYERAAGELTTPRSDQAALLAAHATWLAGQLEGATSAAEVRDAADVKPDIARVASADAELSRWRSANCA